MTEMSRLQDQNFEVVRKRRNPFTAKAWRTGAILGAVSSFIVFLINTSILIFIETRQIPDKETLFEGDCKKAKRFNTIFHIMLNIFSTILLGASNYCSQILMAPTRKEVDKAHREGKWLDIGLISVKNWSCMTSGRRALAAILVLSSLPLHLLYNSTVYLTLQSNSYGIELVTRESDYYRGIAKDPSTPDRYVALEPLECLDAYTEAFLTRYSNLILILDAGPYNHTHAGGGGGIDIGSLCRTGAPVGAASFAWICDKWTGYGGPMIKSMACKGPELRCSKNDIIGQVKENETAAWNYKGGVVEGCLATPTQEHCKIRFQGLLMLVVVVSNLAKLIAILTTISLYGDRQILATVGDACDSFLTRPEPLSKGMCLINRTGVDLMLSGRQYPRWRHFSPGSLQEFRRQPTRWWSLVNLGKWLIVAILCSQVIVVTVLGLVVMNDRYLDIGSFLAAVTTVPLGAVDSRTLAILSGNYAGVALLANTPQLWISAYYLLYNSIYTEMATVREIDAFSKERKYLRVSEPTGKQRSSFFLQLPYRFSVPLMGVSTLMHWLFSQSFFLVSVIDGGYELKAEDKDFLGYSPLGMLATLIVFVGSVLASLVIGYSFRTEGVVPSVGPNSLAISAMCHPPKDDRDAAKSAVMWGEPLARDNVSLLGMESEEVIENMGGTNSEGGGANEVGHCCLTSFPVSHPVEGRYYQ
ncbi:hypothetical protein TWF281_001126 [Arthrobotrys megalospora]